MGLRQAFLWRFNHPRQAKACGLMMSLMASLIFSHQSAFAVESGGHNSSERGKRLYEESCLFCHGEVGQGDGPDAFSLGAYSAPRPRAFTGGEYKFRSTPSGEPPTDYDLFETMTNGIPGFMPSFRGLPEEDRWAIVTYIKQFSTIFQEIAGTPVVLPPGPLPATTASIIRGHELYALLDCAKCHGPEAMMPGGLYEQGELRDRRELDILPRDLHNLPSFKNGHQPRDIAKSILTGLDGTPMASYQEALSPHPEDIWHLVNYLMSLSPQ